MPRAKRAALAVKQEPMEQEPAATSQHALGQVKAEVKDEQVERHAPHAAECAVHLLQGSVKVEPEQQHEEQHQEDEEEEDEGEAYERRRLEQLAKNRAKLEELGIAAAASALEQHVKGSKQQRRAEKGAGTKRAKPATPVEPQPRRVSLRQRNVAADPVLAAGLEEDRKGQVVLAAQSGRVSIWNAASNAAPPAAGADKQEGRPDKHDRRYQPGPVPFQVDDVSERTNTEFLQWLRQRTAAAGDAAAHGSASARSPAKGPSGAGGSGGAGKCVTVRSAPRLKLRSGADVAKLTKEAITHMAFHPSAGELLLAAGDKTGELALWQVDYESAEAGKEQEDDGREGGEAAGQKQQEQKEEEHEAFDGVARLLGVHRQYVSALAWVAPQGGGGGTGVTQLMTASYDGSLRLMDVVKGSVCGGRCLAYAQGEFLDLSKGLKDDTEISAADLDAVGGVAYVADTGGGLEMVDVRSGKAILSERLQLHDLRTNCLHLEPFTRRLLCSASTDTQVKVWDVRLLGRPLATSGKAPKPQCVVDQVRSCHSAVWAPDGSQRVLSQGYDDTVRVWAPAAGTQAARGDAGDAAASSPGGAPPSPLKFKLQPARSIKHDNQTGRWVLPFRAIWGADASFFTIGSMKRGIDIFDASTGLQVRSGSRVLQMASLQSELMTAIPSRLAAHPHAPVLAAATNSGRAHIWRV